MKVLERAKAEGWCGFVSLPGVSADGDRASDVDDMEPLRLRKTVFQPRGAPETGSEGGKASSGVMTLNEVLLEPDELDAGET